MSRGHFDYNQYRNRILDIADELERYIYGEEFDDYEIEEILNDRWIDDEEKQYIKEHKHSKPMEEYDYKPETVAKFKEGLAILRKAYVYAHRIDWLLCGDGEESFHKRLAEDLEELNRKGQ